LFVGLFQAQAKLEHSILNKVCLVYVPTNKPTMPRSNLEPHPQATL